MHLASRRLGALAPLAAALLACSGSTGSAAGGQPPAPVTCHDWPTAATVGIPADTPTLTPMAEESYHTDHDGQVFDHVELLGRLYVDHKNVIVRRSRLVGDVYYAIYSADDATGLIVEDSDIQGGVLFGDGFIGRRNHLHARPGGDKDDGWIFTRTGRSSRCREAHPGEAGYPYPELSRSNVRAGGLCFAPEGELCAGCLRGAARGRWRARRSPCRARPPPTVIALRWDHLGGCFR